jgi:hypothetical protein
MNRIFKYSIPCMEKFTVSLPDGARIIRVDDVDGKFWLWAIVNDDAPSVDRHIECYKTGQPILTPVESMVYLGVCKLFIMQELCLYMFEVPHG